MRTAQFRTISIPTFLQNDVEIQVEKMQLIIKVKLLLIEGLKAPTIKWCKVDLLNNLFLLNCNLMPAIINKR